MKSNHKYMHSVKLFVTAVCLIIATLFTYSGALENAFAYDSRAYLIGNRYITSLSIENIVWMFVNDAMLNWHPLTWLSYALDYKLYGGLESDGFHLTNNILHSANSILVFFVMLIILGLNKSKTGIKFPISTEGRALASAFVAALIFAVHPQHVESVAWVAERKDLLCLFFMLLTFIAYVRYVSANNTKKIPWYLATILLYMLALMSKPMAVTMPVVLLLIDVYPLRRTHMIASGILSIEVSSLNKLLIEKLPFIILSGLSIVVTLVAQTSAMSSLIDIPLSIRILNAFDSIVLYLQKALIPVNYALSYPHLIHKAAGTTAQTWLSICVFFMISMLVLYAWNRKSYVWMISWSYYLVTLSPVIGIIQVGLQGAADRYAYITTLPLYFMLGAGVFALLGKKSRVISGAVIAGALIVNVALIGITQDQIKVWKNPVTLWENTVKLYPEYGVAYGELGSAYYAAGEFKLAAIYFKEANSRGQLLINYLAPAATSYIESGLYGEAFEALLAITVNIEKYPSYIGDVSCSQYNIGWILAKLGVRRDARELFSRAISDPALSKDAKIWVNYLQNYSGEAGALKSLDNMPGYCKDMAQVVRAWDKYK